MPSSSVASAALQNTYQKPLLIKQTTATATYRRRSCDFNVGGSHVAINTLDDCVAAELDRHMITTKTECSLSDRQGLGP